MVLPSLEDFFALSPQRRGVITAEALSLTRALLDVADLDYPEKVVDFRMQAVEIAKSRHLLDSEVLLDLQEIARRCERWIAAAIRRGQQQGRVSRRGGYRSNGGAMSPEDLAKQRIATSLSAYYALYDNLSAEQFEAVIALCRGQRTLAQVPMMDAVHNLSRPTGGRRSEQIAELAQSNHTARQIGRTLRMRPDEVTRIANLNGITLPEGSKGRHIDPERIVRETVTALEGMAIGLRMLERPDFAELDAEDVEQWLESLEKSLPMLTKLKRELTRAKNR